MSAPSFSTMAFPAFTSTQPTTSCRNEYNGYCCRGSIITSDGSRDISQLICCEGDPVDYSVNLGPAASCTAGRAVPLTQVAVQSAAPTQSGDIVVNESQFISAGDGTTLIVVDGSTVAGGASATAAMNAAASSGTTINRSTGSGVTMASTATAAATGSSAASGAFTSRSQRVGALMLMVGWLMATL